MTMPPLLHFNERGIAAVDGTERRPSVVGNVTGGRGGRVIPAILQDNNTFFHMAGHVCNAGMLPTIVVCHHCIALRDSALLSIFIIDSDSRLSSIETEHCLKIVERRMNLMTRFSLHGGQRVFLSKFTIRIQRMLRRALMTSDGREAFVNPRLNP